MRLMPEMLVQERYWHELDKEAVQRQYGASLDGVRAYIEEHITDTHQQSATLAKLKAIRGRSVNNPDSYPPDYVLKYFVAGTFKRELMPKNR